MAAPKPKKVVIEDEAYSSKPVKKQKTFTPRLKTIKSTATRSTPRVTSNKIPFTRARNQTSMTQLDFGRVSFLEVIGSEDKQEICDSDGDEELNSDHEIVDEEHQEVVKEEKPKRLRRSTSKLPGKTESQPSFTQFVRRSSGMVDKKLNCEDEAERPTKRTRKSIASPDSTTAETSVSTKKNRRSKSRLPGKTDSQPSYTQFVRRWPSDATMIEIQDSEDDGVDESVSDAEADLGDEPLQRKASQELGEELPAVLNPTDKHSDQRMADEDPVAEVEDAPRPPQQPPRTPKRARPTIIPSSRSPADSPLSTQVTPRRGSPLEQRSPLRELSANLFRLPSVRRIDTSPSKPSPLKQVMTRASPDVDRVVESPTKNHKLAGAKSVRITSAKKTLALALPIEDTWGSSTSEESQQQLIMDVSMSQAPGRRQTRSSLAAEAPTQLSQEPASLLAKPLPAKRPSQRRSRATAVVKSKKESPTKRRVRDFNARMAMLERENSGRGSKEMQISDFRSTNVQTKNGPKVPAAPKETQYTMPGPETQTALFRLPLEQPIEQLEPEIRWGPSPDIIKNSQAVHVEDEEEHTDERIGDKSRLAHGGTNAELEPFEDACDDGEEVLIPSSQSKGTTKAIRRTVASSQADSDEELDEGEESILFDESLPESPYPPPSARSNTSTKSKDTQDLASDQLLRETQQAFTYMAPSSPAVNMLPPKSTQTQTRDFAAVRPSQATTVDENGTYRHSSFHAQIHQLPATLERKTSAPAALSSSSPPSEPFLPPVLPIASSPLNQPPGLSDGLNSSSPGMPKTPQVLRNLKETRVPLRMEDLMTESLEQSYRMPPGWDSGSAALDEESDDGEL